MWRGSRSSPCDGGTGDQGLPTARLWHDEVMEPRDRRSSREREGQLAETAGAPVRDDDMALMLELLRQTPEQRLIGLRNAARFFGAVRRA
jgi:hypothetical protein